MKGSLRKWGSHFAFCQDPRKAVLRVPFAVGSSFPECLDALDASFNDPSPVLENVRTVCCVKVDLVDLPIHSAAFGPIDERCAMIHDVSSPLRTVFTLSEVVAHFGEFWALVCHRPDVLMTSWSKILRSLRA